MLLQPQPERGGEKGQKPFPARGKQTRSHTEGKRRRFSSPRVVQTPAHRAGRSSHSQDPVPRCSRTPPRTAGAGSGSPGAVPHLRGGLHRGLQHGGLRVADGLRGRRRPRCICLQGIREHSDGLLLSGKDSQVLALPRGAGGTSVLSGTHLLPNAPPGEAVPKDCGHKRTQKGSPSAV